MLVRPDQHIAWRGTACDGEEKTPRAGEWEPIIDIHRTPGIGGLLGSAPV